MLWGIPLGLLMFLVVGMFIVPLIPGFINSLTNNPNFNRPDGAPESFTTRDYAKSTSGFFTYLQPGRVKIIERGNRFIRAIMLYNGHMFKGEQDNPLTPNNEGYWEVVETLADYSDSHPIPFPFRKLWGGMKGWKLVGRIVRIILLLPFTPLRLLWWVWKRWVFNLTGAIFTGIPPFQTVRTYPMEHFKKVTMADGAVQLVRIEDWSDHYRVSDFQFPVQVTAADTKDKIPVDATLTLIAQVYNPYMTSYRTDDDWPTRFSAAIADAVTSFTRPRPLEEVWTAEPSRVQELAETVSRIGDHASGGSVCEFGIKVIRTLVVDISPTDPEAVKKLGALAFARVTRQSDEELAKGRAAYIREEGAALQEHPNADIIAVVEGHVRAAEALAKNPGNIGIFGTVGNAAELAILQELKKRRQP